MAGVFFAICGNGRFLPLEVRVKNLFRCRKQKKTRSCWLDPNFGPSLTPHSAFSAHTHFPKKRNAFPGSNRLEFRAIFFSFFASYLTWIPVSFFPLYLHFLYLAVTLLAPRFFLFRLFHLFFVCTVCVCLYNFSPPNFFTGQRFLCPPPVRPKAREMTKPELKRGVHWKYLSLIDGGKKGLSRVARDSTNIV